MTYGSRTDNEVTDGTRTGSNGNGSSPEGEGNGNGRSDSVLRPPRAGGPASTPPAPPSVPPGLGPSPEDGLPPASPRIKRLRVLFVLFGLAMLAGVSGLFGMVMAVSQDLPAIERYTQYKEGENSVLVDSQGQFVGTLSSNENRFLLEPAQISPNIKNAVVSIEDARFYEHRGFDYRGLARAMVQNVLARSVKQGASTITQQLIKQALEAQNDRTVFQKMKEISLAYHIEREWTKDKILTEYLNTVYFGSGAYGVEAAARTYFGDLYPTCGTEEDPCAAMLDPAQSALLAGIIQNPYGYDPKLNPESSLTRRNLVLQKMLDQGFITGQQYRESVAEPLPAPSSINPPSIDSKAPYFTSWIRQQLVDKYGAGRTFFGGLRIKTSLDLEMQDAAQAAVEGTIGGIGPDAAVVVINNEDATIDAMVAGPDYETAPFNLATQGYRQPGSTVKPFVLVTALQQGVSPYSVYESAPQLFRFGKRKKELFPVSNYGDSYSGSSSLLSATTNSDNSVYAQLGLETIKGTTRAIARNIRRMGVTDKVSTNPAMVLGTSEVTPLQWTYAFSTIANDGDRVSGTLAPIPGKSPVSYTKVSGPDGKVIRDGKNRVLRSQVLPPEVAQTAKSMLATVISSGTGTNASVGDDSQWGKTGTTENNSNAWFCGAITEVTACVWVGYSQGYQEMTTEYGGNPVDGGTFPAIIWSRVIEAWKALEAGREAEAQSGAIDTEYGDSGVDSGGTDYYVPDATEAAPAEPVAPEPAAPAPVAPAAPAAPAAPSGGGSSSSSGGFSPG